jgi:hypothetical protein
VKEERNEIKKLEEIPPALKSTSALKTTRIEERVNERGMKYLAFGVRSVERDKSRTIRRRVEEKEIIR